MVRHIRILDNICTRYLYIGIIIAILFFGGIWGLWGVFFAIPLATLIKAIINAWPEPETLPLAGADAQTQD